MSTETIKTGWLKDKNGDKFAPKTLSSQVQTADGVLLEDKLQDDLNAAKAALKEDIDKKIDTDAVAENYEAKTDAEDKLAEAKAYTDSKTSGLASTSTVNTNISAHNTSDSAHDDIRDLIVGLTTRLNTLANSDDTTLDQMSEIVAYIKNNKDLIDGITTSKVNVADIVDNLTTNVSNKPLSAAQGVALKGLIDALQTALDEHAHDDIYETKEDAQMKYDELKAIQSDWNQEDETASDYIKNRPFYGSEEFFEKSLWMPETSESGGAGSDLEIAQIIFDDYTCATFTIFGKSHSLSGIKSTSNIEIQYSIEDMSNAYLTVSVENGVPTGRIGYYIGGSSSGATIAVSIANSNFKKLDEKYIPDTIARTQLVNTSITTHNTSAEAHIDIRDLISALTIKLNAFLDVDDTTADQLSEVLTLIENNKGTLESLTSSKVNVADIVDDLTTNVANKPLSAAQGVAIKALIDELEEVLNKKAELVHGNHVPDTQDANDAVFLRNDNTWQTVTPENIGATTMDAVANEFTVRLGRSTAVNTADTNYTTYMVRGTSLNSAETNPTVNGTIAWTYE